MYTCEATNKTDCNKQNLWVILDPDGDAICEVVGYLSALALLDHLNR